MNQGTIRDGIALAKQRWSVAHPFDLEDAQWEQLFAVHRPGDVLQAIKISTYARSSIPATRYRFFELKLQQLAQQREFSQIFKQ